MKTSEIIKALRRMSIETGSLMCLGCAYGSKKCGVHGCAIIREAADTIEELNNFTDSQCARLLEKLQEAEKAIPRWISVEERLPDFYETVLVIASGKPKKNIALDHAIMTAVHYESDGWELDEFPEFENPEVTHWMPLPELPGHVLV